MQAGPSGGSTPPPGGQIIITGSGPSTSSTSTSTPKPTSTPTSQPTSTPTSAPEPKPTSTPKPDQCANVACAPLYVARFRVLDGSKTIFTRENTGTTNFGWYGIYEASYGSLVFEGTGRPGATITLTGRVTDQYSTGRLVKPCTATVARDGSWSCRVSFSDLLVVASASVSFTVEQTGVEQNGTDCCPDSSTEVNFNVVYNAAYAYMTVLCTPIAIDFSDQGAVETVSAARAPGVFDMLGDGRPVQSGWLAPSAGFLVYDADGDGAISSVDELFGGDVGEGYARLAAFDTDEDGVVSDADAGYHQLGVWRDWNMNKSVDAGELFTLVEAGVVSLDLDHVDYWTGDDQGNYAYERSTAVLADGSVAAMADVYFRYTPATR